LANRVTELETDNLILKTENQELRAENQELKSRLSQNSQNSHKPPSSDGLKKAKRKGKNTSLRKKSGHSSGGQKGHKGSTLDMSNDPDRIENHPVHDCQGCGVSLEDIGATEELTRQSFDVELPVVKCTEHRAEVKVCPHCQHVNVGQFPDHVTQPVQYGTNIKSFLVYLNQYQFIPYGRVREMFKDIFGHSISEGTLSNTIETAYNRLGNYAEGLKEALKNVPILGHDETSLRVSGKLRWLHVACTEFLTYYGLHKNRGKEAMDEIGILPNFKGSLIHDCWLPYFDYGENHGLCNAHILRELVGIHESVEHKWSLQMEKLLLRIKKQVENNRTANLSANQIASFERQYDSILQKGFKEELATRPPDPPPKQKRGRTKQTKAKNLLDRLDKHRRYVLAFMYDPEIPFDNNQSERDGRMMKVKQKISGCFRSEDGGKRFCRIRSYISTSRKNGQPVFEAIRGIFTGNLFIPPGVMV
jgi:transposase